MINWILQKNITNQGTLNRIKNVLLEDQVSFEEVNIIPFSEEFPAIQNQDKYPIVYGSTTMMINAYRHPFLKKGVFFAPNQFNIKNYVDHWGEDMLNADGKLIRFKDVKGLVKSDQLYFIRPNSDEKEFGGKLLNGAELVKWYNKIERLDIQQLRPNTELWIAQPKNILKEWRIFVVDEAIISISKYMEKGEADFDGNDIPSTLLNYVEQQIRTYQPHDIFVLDVALVDNGYKIIECNCFNGTGFYDHDIEKIIRAINQKFAQKNKG